ncbi:hypothetical protein DFH06DRAFT_1151641 [Mycena polygramma]|nr:hypothetical protein DFH06DRAFT_1154035 [Mycena polygramma]KAJ7603764.1 hypothetical protein DFH06DRAFT_1151641 [Mycena polygramma]
MVLTPPFSLTTSTTHQVLMRRTRPEVSASNAKLDELNFARRGLGGDPTITTQRPVMRRTHQELVAEEESAQQKMANVSKRQRAATLKDKAEKAEIRRAKARERMAISFQWDFSRRAKIKALPPDEQHEYQNRARLSRAKWREENRRYLAVASWGYRHRKYVDLYEKLSGTDRTLYDQYLTTSTNRRAKKMRAQRIAERRSQPSADAGADVGSDLPDSSEISTSDSE